MTVNDIDDLIRYHEESEFLDFKSQEYASSSKVNLIKDVMAFANAPSVGNKYIIIGVKKKDGNIETFDIQSQYDQASIQQTIHANITPEISIDYISHSYEGMNLMVIVIYSPTDQPYMINKPVYYSGAKPALKVGECWIRKGSYQVPAERKDYDRMYAAKTNPNRFSGKLIIGISGGKDDSITLKPKDIQVPSQERAEYLKQLIEKKEKLQKDQPDVYRASIRTPRFASYGSSYEDRDLNQLRKDLEEVGERYASADFHAIFEKYSHKINIDIVNVGSTYLEDASIEILISKHPKIMIADQIYSAPQTSNVFSPPRLNTSFLDYDTRNYPKVQESDSSYKIIENIGDIKHNIPCKAFKVPIRLAVFNVNSSIEIEIVCKIFGKNIESPIEKQLTIKVEN